MTVLKSVGHLTHGAMSTAVTVARHPVSSTAQTLGFVKGVAEIGVDLVRGHPRVRPSDDLAAGTGSPAPASGVDAGPAPEAAQVRDLPGPDVAVAALPRIGELPEPIVIEADDTAGEAFHNEPKASSRASEHGGPAGDREEAHGYDEEIFFPGESDLDLVTPLEQDQPGTEPLLDPAVAKAIRSETRTLQQGADQQKG